MIDPRLAEAQERAAEWAEHHEDWRTYKKQTTLTIQQYHALRDLAPTLVVGWAEAVGALADTNAGEIGLLTTLAYEAITKFCDALLGTEATDA